MVQTAWVVITLLHANYPDKDRIKKAVKVIMDRQLSDGSWAQEQIEGIFNRYVTTLLPASLSCTNKTRSVTQQLTYFSPLFLQQSVHRVVERQKL